MDFLWNGIFWGVVLIIFGLSVILKAVFHIDIPVFRLFVAFIFIYIGVKIIIGDKIIKPKATERDVIFSEGEFKYNSEKTKEYNIIFGSGKIDLSDVGELTENKVIKINTIFGGGSLILKKNTPFRLKTSVAFGGISFPEGEAIYFGEKELKQGEKSTYFMDVELNVVFGGFKIFYKD
ncbi:MAG: hypothetical protein ACP5QT_01350 [Brevinematia bacterium]